MSFEEQWDNDGFLSNCSMQDAKHFYESGAASRQAKVDELQKRIESITETLIDHLDYEYDELDCPSYDAMLYALREVKEILKGN